MNCPLPKTAPCWWIRRCEDAALLLAWDVLSDKDIPRRVGVCLHTLSYWKEHVDFAGRANTSILANFCLPSDSPASPLAASPTR